MRISDRSSDVCSSDLSTWPWLELRIVQGTERAKGNSGAIGRASDTALGNSGSSRIAVAVCGRTASSNHLTGVKTPHFAVLLAFHPANEPPRLMRLTGPDPNSTHPNQADRKSTRLN